VNDGERELPEAVSEPVEKGVETGVVPRTAITAELRQGIRKSQPLVRRLMDEMGAEIVKVE
jgi:hypothetical protein